MSWFAESRGQHRTLQNYFCWKGVPYADFFCICWPFTIHTRGNTVFVQCIIPLVKKEADGFVREHAWAIPKFRRELYTHTHTLVSRESPRQTIHAQASPRHAGYMRCVMRAPRQAKARAVCQKQVRRNLPRSPLPRVHSARHFFFFNMLHPQKKKQDNKHLSTTVQKKSEPARYNRSKASDSDGVASAKKHKRVPYMHPLYAT